MLFCEASQMGPYTGSQQSVTSCLPPGTDDREILRAELRAILASHHFLGSKRYPAFLKYVVEASLEGRTEDLKERTLGIEVFGRDPNYDTNADPVVRISASEVRKRLAQYYQENGHHSRFRIELPLGSYVPEFRLLEPAAIQTRSQELEHRAGTRGTRLSKHRFRARILALAIVLGAGVVGAVLVYHNQTLAASRPSILERFWGPVLQSTRPALIVLRTAPPARTAESEPLTVEEHVRYVSVSIATALASLASVLNEHGKNYEIKEAPETTLTDLRSRPVILVGALGNDWTMRLVSQLRFHFSFSPDGLERIEDSINPGQTDWQFNRSQPFTSATADYAIVARFHNATTEGPVMVIAGIGAYGTEAAGEFVRSPESLAQVSKALPPGWENKNVELVLRTDVIGYHAGPPVLLSAISW